MSSTGAGATKVFVIGATGVLGRPSVRGLVAAGHEVSGLARSPEKAAMLEDLGARPVQFDVFDRAALAAALGWTARASPRTRSPIVCDRSSARHASSARYIARAIVHGARYSRAAIAAGPRWRISVQRKLGSGPSIASTTSSNVIPLGAWAKRKPPLGPGTDSTSPARTSACRFLAR